MDVISNRGARHLSQYFVKNCIILMKRLKINVKDARVGNFIKNTCICCSTNGRISFSWAI